MQETKYALSLENLSKLYGNRTIIKDLNYNFEKGKFYAILGESGCGKTTLLNVMGLLDNKYIGKIIIDGIAIDKKKDQYNLRNQKIGYVFQSYYLIDYLNVKENIILPLEYSKEKLDYCQFESIIRGLNLEQLLTEKVNHLSGGEKQRIAIARALLLNPAILLCDEPTGNLDYKNSKDVFNLLKLFQDSKKTFIIVTHNEDIAKQCDIVLKLDKGKMYEIKK
ncbi:MAG: ABC transporter ATP-binding protein [Roseburia sp.]|nr:ABC transporter ATP-binding protein [Anaeroplasma bactoclasticum]MCM1195559.1 ABC transporter ATP-binding protein [Roseburia sp.]MCM1555974.1 ABC transporter ATP-binding protein [Anaeroplasma bactoclasticum]